MRIERFSVESMERPQYDFRCPRRQIHTGNRAFHAGLWAKHYSAIRCSNTWRVERWWATHDADLQQHVGLYPNIGWGRSLYSGRRREDEALMHTIFFAWKGTYDALLALTDAETGTWFYSHGKTRTAIVGPDLFIGAIEAHHPSARHALNKLDQNFMLLPGPNGKLDLSHATFLATMLPSLNIKEGDPCATVLSYVHSLFGDHVFNPNIY